MWHKEYLSFGRLYLRLISSFCNWSLISNSPLREDRFNQMLFFVSTELDFLATLVIQRFFWLIPSRNICAVIIDGGRLPPDPDIFIFFPVNLQRFDCPIDALLGQVWSIDKDVVEQEVFLLMFLIFLRDLMDTLRHKRLVDVCLAPLSS